jgi:hypothetical protein
MRGLQTMAKILMISGAVIFIAGLIWHWRGVLGLGQLPGDLVFKRGNFTLYFPLATSLLLSLIVSLILWIFRN